MRSKERRVVPARLTKIIEKLQRNERDKMRNKRIYRCFIKTMITRKSMGIALERFASTEGFRPASENKVYFPLRRKISGEIERTKARRTRNLFAFKSKILMTRFLSARDSSSI